MPTSQLTTSTDSTLIARDPQLRAGYWTVARSYLPRLLGAIDRNPFRQTYGCLDREFWHYRTSDFPCQMHQEAVWPLALVYARAFPGNRWHGQPRLRELVIAALRFTASSSHADGSCDDYYPFERALGAAVFSLCAAAAAYRELQLDEPDVIGWLERRGDWLMGHDETGRLANHQALAALGLARVAALTGADRFARAAEARVEKVLGWQSAEGWFDEYGGADPGYQTVTIDALANYARLRQTDELQEPLARAVRFARWFLHPDDSYGGEYGSRGTYHFYPHGMELLAGEDAAAAELAEGFLRSLQTGAQAHFDDDRMYAHRLGNLLEAYCDWAPRVSPAPRPAAATRYLDEAQLLIRTGGASHTVVSAARGGVFKHIDAGGTATTDAGLVVETADGKIAVSQLHDRTSRKVECTEESLTVAGPLHWARFETATPVKLVIFRVLLLVIGRWCRGLVRWLLQKRLITGRKPAPLHLTRKAELLPQGRLRVTDAITLSDPQLRVRRMSYASDLQATYVAASNVYQQSALEAWTDLGPHVEQLNRERQVTIVREW